MQAIQITDLMINRFYKFKRFLTQLGVINAKLGEFTFLMQHRKMLEEPKESIGSKLNVSLVSNILSYIPVNPRYKVIQVNKCFYQGFKESINIYINEILKEVLISKMNIFDLMNKYLPEVFAVNMFSDYFLMLTDMVNNDQFFSKEQISDIKKMKIINSQTEKLCKITLAFINENPDVKVLSTGEVKYLYVDKIKQLANNNTLFKKINQCNVLDIPIKKFLNLYSELDDLFKKKSFDEIKKMNRGLSQLLNWVFIVYEINKIFNPIDFVSSDYILNRFSDEDREAITYFIQILLQLKDHFKLKWKFFKSLEIPKHFDFLKEYFNKNNNLKIFQVNSEHQKVVEIYNESKNVSNIY